MLLTIIVNLKNSNKCNQREFVSTILFNNSLDQFLLTDFKRFPHELHFFIIMDITNPTTVC